MSDKPKKNKLKVLTAISISIVLVIICMRNIDIFTSAFTWFTGIIMPLIIGCGIAIFINVPMRFLEKRLWRKSEDKFWCAIRRPVAFALSMVFIVGCIVGVVWIVIPELFEAVKVLIQSATVFVQKISSMTEEELAELPFGELLTRIDWNGLLDNLKNWLTNQSGTIVNTLFGTITTVAKETFSLVLSVVFAVNILLVKEKLKNMIKRILKVWFPKRSEFITHALSIANASFRNYIAGQLLESAILTSLVLVGMLIFRFPYALMISVLIGVLTWIPMIGVFVGAGLGAFMILTVDPMKALWFIVFFVVLQQIEGNLIYPRVMGKRVNLPGIWILAAFTIGGGLGGPVGMLLSIPIFSTVYILFKEATDKKEKRLTEESSENGGVPEVKEEFVEAKAEENSENNGATEAESEITEVKEEPIEVKEEPAEEQDEVELNIEALQ